MTMDVFSWYQLTWVELDKEPLNELLLLYYNYHLYCYYCYYYTGCI